MLADTPKKPTQQPDARLDLLRFASMNIDWEKLRHVPELTGDQQIHFGGIG